MQELQQNQRHSSVAHAQAEVGDSILSLCNPVLPHSANGRRGPVQAEEVFHGLMSARPSGP